MGFLDSFNKDIQILTEAHTYSTNYLEGRDHENCGPRLAQRKSYWDPISMKKLGVVEHTFGPSYNGGMDRGLQSEAGLGQKSTWHHMKNN
jgi:hypothetical protein